MSASYDRAITVFSPDGHLLQVEYAMKAVERGSSVVGIRCPEAVILGVEKRTAPKLQNPRTLRKLVQIDEHVVLGFAGLNADARVLVDRARVECQSYRLTFEDKPPVESIARSIAELQQKYTRRGGTRPFGISTFIAGFDGKTPQLYRTRPAGTHTSWKANATGRAGTNLRQYLEKNYKDGMSKDEGVELAVKTLLEVVENGAKNMEIAVLTPEKPMYLLSSEDLAGLVKKIEDEKEAKEKEEKRRRGGGK